VEGQCNFFTISDDIQKCLTGFSDECLAGANGLVGQESYCPYVQCVLSYTECLYNLDCEIFTQALLNSNLQSLQASEAEDAAAAMEACDLTFPAWFEDLQDKAN